MITPWQFDALTPHSEPLSPFAYDIICIDPPWNFQNYSEKGQVKGAQPHYDCMKPEDLMVMRVADLARPNCLMLMWATECMRQLAHHVMDVWGFKYQSAMIWRKVTINGKPRMGTGYRVRTMHEPILVGTMGKPCRTPFPSVVDGIAREHSRKPEEFYRMVRLRTPGLRRCDLFARERHPGFDGWGNEYGLFNQEDSARRASADREAHQTRQSARIA